jgi:hypothetical protein
MTPRQGYLLLALSKAPDGYLSPVQIQKAMFLLKEEAPKLVGQGFYTFKPYNYGPFCSTIYEDLSTLAAANLLVTQSAGRYPIYTITKEGLLASETISKKTDTVLEKYINDVVVWIKGQSFASLLHNIYEKYPKYAVNSVFNR